MENQTSPNPEIQHTHILSWSNLVKMKDSIRRIRELHPILLKNSIVKKDKENCQILLNLQGEESLKSFEFMAWSTKAKLSIAA